MRGGTLPAGRQPGAAFVAHTDAASRCSSGTHDAQLVPARVAAPMAAGERAPLAIAAMMRARPTWKQAHTSGPASAPPSGRPASSARRSPGAIAGNAKHAFSHSADGNRGWLAT